MSIKYLQEEYAKMNNNKYGDANIPDVEVGPLTTNYMCLFGINVNLQRAIPMVQDGLKPVQRRTLYQLYKNYRNAYKVRVSVLMGDVMKIHPHGDQGLGDTIVRMCQPFTNNIPLINALGNAGNMTSAGLRALPQLTFISAGLLSDFFPPIQGSTVAPPTECPGSMMRKPWMWSDSLQG